MLNRVAGTRKIRVLLLFAHNLFIHSTLKSFFHAPRLAFLTLTQQLPAAAGTAVDLVYLLVEGETISPPVMGGHASKVALSNKVAMSHMC